MPSELDGVDALNSSKRRGKSTGSRPVRPRVRGGGWLLAGLRCYPCKGMTNRFPKIRGINDVHRETQAAPIGGEQYYDSQWLIASNHFKQPLDIAATVFYSTVPSYRNVMPR